MVMPSQSEKQPRTPNEVRELIRALKAARSAPCNCHERGPTHSFQCVAGGRMMDAGIEALLWTQGEDSDVNESILKAFREGAL